MPDLNCTTCGHPPEDHAEFVDNDQIAARGLSERRQCLRGLTFAMRRDHRGGVLVGHGDRECECEKYEGPKMNGASR